MRSGVSSIAIGLARQRERRRRARDATASRSKRARKASALERARDGAAVGAAAERQVDPRAGLDVAERAPRRATSSAARARHRRRRRRRAASSRVEAVALAERRGQFDRRAFGRVGQRRDQVGRGHPAAGVGAQASGAIACARASSHSPPASARGRRAVDRAARSPGDSSERRRRTARCRSRRRATSQRADPRAEIGHPVDLRHARRIVERRELRRGRRARPNDQRRGAAAVDPGHDRCARTRRATPHKSRTLADHPRRRSDRCGGEVLKVKLTGRVRLHRLRRAVAHETSEAVQVAGTINMVNALRRGRCLRRRCRADLARA